MILAYCHCFGADKNPELCIVPDKPDQMSVAAIVDTFIPTDAAIYRCGPFESMRVRRGEAENSLIFEPMIPSKLYVTPNLSDRPGVAAKKIQVVIKGERQYEVTYIADSDSRGTWKKWSPNSNV